jgi:hypothetical protein
MDPGVELRMMKPETARQICLGMRDGEPISARYRHEIIGQSRKSAVSPSTGLSLFPAVGQYWASVTPNRSTFVNGLLPPNSTNCLGGYKDSRNGKDAAFGLRCASSWHSGGVNIAFASGSVKFIRDDMIRDLYTSLFSIDRDDSDMYLGGVYSDFSQMPRFHGVKPEGK